MARWLEVLSQYDFTLEHRIGAKHGNADGLSRIPCEPDLCQNYDNKTSLKDLPCGGCKDCERKSKEWAILDEFDDVVPLIFQKND